MNQEQENFDHLRRLLKLKRYEQPHPRYFNEFSSRVIARISAGEAGGREVALDSGSWLVKLWSLIDAKPMLPGAIGVAICALLVLGAFSTEPTHPNVPGSMFPQTQPAAPAPEAVFPLSRNQGEPRPVAFASTNIQMSSSLFDQIRPPTPGLIARPFGNN